MAPSDQDAALRATLSADLRPPERAVAYVLTRAAFAEKGGASIESAPTVPLRG